MVSWEPASAEAHYHRSCYRSYTREVKSSLSSASELNIVNYKEAEYKAFSDLYHYVGTAIFMHPKVIQSTDLTFKYSFIATERHQGNWIQQKKYIWWSFEGEFEDILNIFPDTASKLLVLPNDSVQTKLSSDTKGGNL